MIGEALGGDDVRFHQPLIGLLDLLGDPAQLHRRERFVVETGEQQHGVLGVPRNTSCRRPARLSISTSASRARSPGAGASRQPEPFSALRGLFG